jgi:hypothetical protein
MLLFPEVFLLLKLFCYVQFNASSAEWQYDSRSGDGRASLHNIDYEQPPSKRSVAVIARDVSPVAISVFSPVILRERSDRRISGGSGRVRFFATLRMTAGKDLE